MEPCRFRGNRLDHVPCDLCDKRKGTLFSLYACELHGQCTEGKVVRAIKGCKSCQDRKPPGVDHPPDAWAAGVTTVPQRRDDLLPRTLASLKIAGFDSPHLFVDGTRDAESYRPLGLEFSLRYPTIKTMGNWLLGLQELFIRHPFCGRYLMCQDDLVASRNLKSYLDQCEYPPKGYLSLFTMPDNQQLCPPGHVGWYPSNQAGKGAVALAFSHEAVVALLTSGYVLEKLQSVQGHRLIDGTIADTMQRAGFQEYVHNPSLVQHTGTNSSMGSQPQPLADSFPGEDFDALTLTGRSSS
jgi:hypothetical protein